MIVTVQFFISRRWYSYALQEFEDSFKVLHNPSPPTPIQIYC